MIIDLTLYGVVSIVSGFFGFGIGYLSLEPVFGAIPPIPIGKAVGEA